jgi:predicted outer membrane repeat protein
MLTFPIHTKTAWNDYFTGNPNSTLSGEHGATRTLSGTGVHVSNCLFSSCTSTNHGGAFYCTSVTYLLVESTSFFSCKTSGYTGAIYFQNTNDGQCVLNEVCGYDCCSTSGYSEGQFSFTNVYNVASSKNYVNYSSITRCMNQISNSHGVLNPRNGKVCCSSINMSMNKSPCIPTIWSDPFSDSNSVTSSLTYSSFTDNTAIITIGFQLWRSGVNHEIKSCNILRNTQNSLSSYGTIITQGNLMIEDSCILENKADYIFRQYSSYTITLSNCTVDSTSNNGYLITRNTVAKSFILALNHMSTQNCHSEYDAVGYLTPITPKKQVYCNTNGNSFCQSRLRYLVSLISIFIFNFIHLNASNLPLY